ncbi:LysE family translocator [Brackiella oedipodis]|uniref:LysE family translocator n=1 Tax=Brackiella oedipodis TaxID=124225 RepID=UPI00048C1036|nr:LysE family translocator [Brackiella oedipodis]
MPYLHEFLILAGVHFFAVVVPGIDFAVVTQQSISNGRQAGVITAIGIGLGISLHVLYTVLGFGLIVHTNQSIFTIIKVISALYLVYLGLSMIRQNLRPRRPSPEAVADQVGQQLAAKPQSIRASLIKGFVTNATNPKATIFFLGIFTSLVSPSTPIKVQLLYGLWMCFVNAGWFMLVAYLFSTRAVRDLFLQKKKWFEIAMGVLLITLAINLLVA